MAWKYETTNYASSDYYFEKAVTASSGKAIKAGGYWISGISENTEVWTHVNGPATDSNGVGVQWVTKGRVPSPPGSWSLVVYVYEE